MGCAQGALSCHGVSEAPQVSVEFSQNELWMTKDASVEPWVLLVKSVLIGL